MEYFQTFFSFAPPLWHPGCNDNESLNFETKNPAQYQMIRYLIAVAGLPFRAAGHLLIRDWRVPAPIKYLKKFFLPEKPLHGFIQGSKGGFTYFHHQKYPRKGQKPLPEILHDIPEDLHIRR
jgi:hypothetical protein